MFVGLLNSFQWNKISGILGPLPFPPPKALFQSHQTCCSQPSTSEQGVEWMGPMPICHFVAYCRTQRCRLCPRSPNAGIGCFMDRVFMSRAHIFLISFWQLKLECHCWGAWRAWKHREVMLLGSGNTQHQAPGNSQATGIGGTGFPEDAT